MVPNPMTTASYDAQTGHMDLFEPPAEVAGLAEGSASNATPTPKRLAQAYERFLGMPVLAVLAVMWVAGAVLLGSCALVLYVVGSLVVGTIAGSA
jgi:hypothetical protein